MSKKYRLVTDGKLFAIEKGWIFKKYLSLSLNYWWSGDEADMFSWGSESEVRNRYEKLTRYKRITVVND